ncbi:AAA family ATPase [Sphingopyxis sp. MWB1]|uniref:AAA family ATPase n=1 Tax=Sphingopyxis sp. MWB1 TaxID=1537715 RepID=UPI00051A542C|nr:ATP-binding protein [Sphingopyxis sp. MWB1]
MVDGAEATEGQAEEIPLADPPPPPRIKELRLSNFRAFPGPATVTIPTGGKNAVIFGENGSGKSTIFHALDGFFSVAERNRGQRRRRLEDNVNLFSPDFADKTWVEVEFTDDVVERWDQTRHPCDPGEQRSQRVYAAGYRKAFLDYRALLETNFRHSSGAINLFDVCVHGALRDFRATHEGSETSLRELWRVLEKHINPPWGNMAVGRDETERNLYRTSFNTGLAEALDAMLPLINEMLAALHWDDILVESFDFPRLTYNNEWTLRHRDFDGKRITPRIKFSGEELDTPHLSLNEARQSALALAIYFAGRKLCGETTLADVPKLMVLDDVIVGLDQSNRLPVLDLLAEKFKDWQIIILTHDRVWFDMTRSYHRRHQADRFWAYSVLNAAPNLLTCPTPLSVSSSAPKEAIGLARTFLAEGHISAAGNATRIAAERAIREFCEEKKIPVKYQVDHEKIAFSDFYKAAREWSNKSSQGIYRDVLDNLQMYVEILLNRLSHGGTPQLERYDVEGAITATDALILALKVVSKYEQN